MTRRVNSTNSAPLRDLSFISKIRIRGLVTSKQTPITLSRAQSFPACRFSGDIEDVPPIPTWGPLPLPTHSHTVDLQLASQPISEGRVGIVYSAEVTEPKLDSTTSDSVLDDSDVTLPREICVKIVKEEFARRAAREAWFYEQLAHTDCPGVATPRCFGFFTAHLKDFVDEEGNIITPDRVESWCSAKFHDSDYYSKASPEGDIAVPEDILLDDQDMPDRFCDDQGHWEASPWNEWKPSPDDPLLCVLLLEKLGDHYANGPQLTENEEEHLEDIRQVVFDLGSTGIAHRDLRYANVLRVPSSTETAPQVCPRHKRRHGWRLIDFDCSMKYVFTAAVPSDERKATRGQVEEVGDSFWWGWL